MSGEPVLVEIADGVATVTLNRPQAFNAMDMALAEALAAAAERLAADAAVRAVVLTGAGEKAFCAGGDVAAFAADPDTVDRFLLEITGHLNRAVAALRGMEAPVIAAVNGIAAGAGLSLVAAADIAIAADTAKFTSAYTQIGLSPDAGSTWFLSRLIGPRRAAELYLCNPLLTAAQALEWGILTRVVPAAELRAEAAAQARRFAEGPTRSFGAVKRLLATAATVDLDAQMALEGRTIAALSRTADGLEGVGAFAAKRKPTFTGR